MPSSRPATLWSDRNGACCCALAFAVLVSPGCEGTKHLIFDPIEPLGHVGQIPIPDAGKVVPDAGHKPPPIIDAGSTEEEDAGSDKPEPKVDFVWTESLPGQGTCHAGRYAGSFDCTLRGADLLPLTFSGQIAFTLEGSPEEQRLAITDGTLSGLWLYSDMSGSLDCIDETWDARSVDGHVLVLDVDLKNPFLVGFPRFDAVFQGRYDDQALVIEGAIAMVNERMQECSGNFRVSAVP